MNYPMTKNGEKALKAQLQFLQEKERPRIAEALHKAASLGDLVKMLNTILQKTKKT